MAKTVPPGQITIQGVDFIANALPDPFDQRDLEYRPRLELLPAVLDRRHVTTRKLVLQQQGSSCTGHAVAAMVNTLLAHASSTTRPRLHGKNGKNGAKAAPERVSPYMLYWLGRRYDEFAGMEDAGSSLRGVLKGWFHHGAVLEAEWQTPDLDPVPDLDDLTVLPSRRDRPLGAFYRVNPYRLDDMQSAINELGVIVASAVIHTGWIAPTPVFNPHTEETLYLINREVNSQSLGGHAFAIVGYNEVGFLVQNSWGPEWGKDGFATLAYEDWLDSAYDAWVARLGVPQTPFATGRQRTKDATGGQLVTAPGPDLKRLAMHVVNLGNDGQLSTTGKFVSTPHQVDTLFERMNNWHSRWLAEGVTTKRHIVLYAHGGLTSEADGLDLAQRQVNWWLNNGVYPLFFAWQSGPHEALLDQLVDIIKGRLPFGLGFDLTEQVDRMVEGLARTNLRWMWDQMKQNARVASEPVSGARQPGASLTVARLQQYIEAHQAGEVVVHLVGHSAGSIFHAGLLQRLIAAGIPVDSLTFLGAAIRVDEFEQKVLPHLGTEVARFATFAMSDTRELDDVCGVSGISVYNKSLLYLVARALETPAPGQNTFEVPLLGMQHFLDAPTAGGGATLSQTITAAGGAVIFAPMDAPDNRRSDVYAHGAFDDDMLTMTSVLLHVLGLHTAQSQHTYRPNVPLLRDYGTVPPTAASPETALSAAVPGGDGEPLMAAANTNPPSMTPLAETAPAQETQPTAPSWNKDILPELAVAPVSGSPVLDMLFAHGWTYGASTGTTSAKRRKRSSAPRAME